MAGIYYLDLGVGDLRRVGRTNDPAHTFANRHRVKFEPDTSHFLHIRSDFDHEVAERLAHCHKSLWDCRLAGFSTRGSGKQPEMFRVTDCRGDPLKDLTLLEGVDGDLVTKMEMRKLATRVNKTCNPKSLDEYLAARIETRYHDCTVALIWRERGVLSVWSFYDDEPCRDMLLSGSLICYVQCCTKDLARVIVYAIGEISRMRSLRVSHYENANRMPAIVIDACRNSCFAEKFVDRLVNQFFGERACTIVWPR